MQVHYLHSGKAPYIGHKTISRASRVYIVPEHLSVAKRHSIHKSEGQSYRHRDVLELITYHSLPRHLLEYMGLIRVGQTPLLHSTASLYSSNQTRGIDLEQPDDKGCQAMHFAAKKGCPTLDSYWFKWGQLARMKTPRLHSPRGRNEVFPPSYINCLQLEGLHID
jgi:hypothetical protein